MKMLKYHNEKIKLGLIILLIFNFKLGAVIFDFETQNDEIILRGNGNGSGPSIDNGFLKLIDGGREKNQQNHVIFPVDEQGIHRIWEIDFRMYITRGAEGCGIALINTDIFTDDSLALNMAKWQEPAFDRSFCLGFDIYNPPTSHWFDEFGNFYDRPQREISLHWDDQEIVKVISPFEFRADPAGEDDFLQYLLRIEYLVGGAEISLLIDDNQVFDRYFIPGMQTYPFRLSAGAQTSELTTTVYLDDIRINLIEPADPPQKPILINAVVDQPIFIDTRDSSHQVEFPRENSDFGRVIMNLSLGEMPGGYDPWDKGGAVYLNEGSTRYELCRFITPYGRGYVWKVDVTDFLPLFKGRKQLDLHVDTWMKKEEDPMMQKGWVTDIDFEFYHGSPIRKPIAIRNIWNGFHEYGNPENPLTENLPAQNIRIPEQTSSARLRIVVTGHGMYPNDLNAGEFMLAGRTVLINDRRYENLLWKTDCYLNPCRPQGGTWKFDRAGWAPGSIVMPWLIELDNIVPGDTLNLEYLPDQYLNSSEGDHFRAHHWFESQIIFYR
ncbi:MAG: hypothetical protein JW996_00355 [Candidatus Cloacimonetes bacterium]|nr:hypothetical protein [Candidatus Cloacimonadota bacterium]